MTRTSLCSGPIPSAVRRAFADVRAKLAGALRDSGEREKAIEEYELVIKQNPNYVPARLNLGLSLYAAGRRDDAVKQWRTVLEISPGNRNAELYLQLAGTG